MLPFVQRILKKNTKIEEENIGNIWFQQDGATYHTAEATLDVLRPVFEDRNCENIKYFF